MSAENLAEETTLVLQQQTPHSISAHGRAAPAARGISTGGGA